MIPVTLLDVLLAGGSIAGLAAALLVAVHPIPPMTIGIFTIAARDPMRPLLAALVFGGVYYARSAWLADRLRRLLAAASRLSWWPVAALALGVFVAADVHGAFVAGGSDSYGYISQADLWLKGDLHIAQPFAADAPWHDARWSFTPLGYRPAADGSSIVPTYAPGLPLLMAAAKRVGGQCALFLVVPMSAAVFVFATCLIGRRLGRPLVGLAAALLVATSPTTLYMAMAPLSDLPAAAAWALTFAGVLGDTRLSAFCGGAAAAVAIIIRPNLVLLAGLCGIFIFWRDAAAFRSRSRPPVRAPWFVASAGLGAFIVGLINQRLYGSPLVSGYGEVDFAWSHVLRNLETYPAWLAAVETPLAFVGLASLFTSSAAIWPTRRQQHAARLFAACAVVVALVYLAYTSFETWTYLRFFLPIWPLMMTGTAAALAALHRGDGRWRQAAALCVLIWLVAHGLTEGRRRGAYALAEDEHRYVEAARLVARETPPDSVILAVQHSGSLRYYAGRMTIRWDQIDRDALDRAVGWLSLHGRHPYFLVEGLEAAQIVRQYGPANAAGRLDWTPLAVLDGPNAITLYDASDRRQSSVAPKQVIAVPPGRGDRCLLPAPTPSFGWH